MRKSTALSIVIPCKDEAANIAVLIDLIREHVSGLVSDLSIIVVDDGSTDGTQGVVANKAAQYGGITCISLSRSFGKEAALLAGLQEADGDLVALMDGDLQHPPAVLAELLSVQRATGADQVVGVRSRSGESGPRKLLSRVFARSLAAVSEFPLPQGQGDFRIVTARVRKAVLALTETTRFNRGIFAWVGFPTIEVEYTDERREQGGSRWTAVQLLGYGLDGLLSFSARPLRFLIGLGIALMALFFVYVVIVVVRVAVLGVETPGYATLIAAVFFVGGMQALSVGVLGEYLGRIFIEVKRRPHFVVKEHVRARDMSQ